MSLKFTQTSYKLEDKQTIAATSTAAVLSSQFGDYIETYRVAPAVDCWIATGSSAVTAQSSAGNTTSSLFFAGIPEYINTNDRYFSILPSNSSGSISITGVTQ